jgi:hypothetical protein
MLDKAKPDREYKKLKRGQLLGQWQFKWLSCCGAIVLYQAWTVRGHVCIVYTNIPFVKNAVSGVVHLVALIETDVSEEHSGSIIRVTRISELGTTLTVTSNLSRWWWRGYVPPTRLLSPWWRRRYIPLKHLFLQEPHGITSLTTALFIVTVMKTTNVTYCLLYVICAYWHLTSWCCESWQMTVPAYH